MGNERKSRIAYRGEDGKLISEAQAKQLPKREYTREHLPLPGNGDVDRKKK